MYSDSISAAINSSYRGLMNGGELIPKEIKRPEAFSEQD
jgi:hypothetical protein